MAQVITIENDVLTYVKDSESSIILCAWVCDKHQDKVFIKDAFGFPPINLGKISVDNPVTIGGEEFTNPTLARAAIGRNW